MIDHPDQVERLMERLSATLPIPARVTPEVQLDFPHFMRRDRESR
jgi:hypothetical protein